PNDPRYGGRGIRVCDRWRSFDSFLRDVGFRPAPEMSLERLDNDGDYGPGNCAWASSKVQARNRRSTRRIAGVSLGELAEQSGIGYPTLQSRLDRGWPVDRATTVPTRSYYRASRAVTGGPGMEKNSTSPKPAATLG